MKPVTNEVEILVDLLFKYLVKFRPDQHWSVTRGAQGQLLSSRWPYRVPETIFRRMREEAGC